MTQSWGGGHGGIGFTTETQRTRRSDLKKFGRVRILRNLKLVGNLMFPSELRALCVSVVNQISLCPLPHLCDLTPKRTPVRLARANRKESPRQVGDPRAAVNRTP